MKPGAINGKTGTAVMVDVPKGRSTGTRGKTVLTKTTKTGKGYPGVVRKSPSRKFR